MFGLASQSPHELTHSYKGLTSSHNARSSWAGWVNGCKILRVTRGNKEFLRTDDRLDFTRTALLTSGFQRSVPQSSNVDVARSTEAPPLASPSIGAADSSRPSTA